MKCPVCGFVTHVCDSRAKNKNNFVYRRRECLKCGRRFSTKEVYKETYMDTINIVKRIELWLIDQIKKTGLKGFVVGVSGGIDSAVVSTLCAKTKYPVICVRMPLKSSSESLDRAGKHVKWLMDKYTNVTDFEVDLGSSFENYIKCLPEEAKKEIALVNTKSRFRMTTLYAFAGSNEYFVVGTGNKVEDFGIGFFTKFGDGACDISPIGDLKKTQVYDIAKYLEIIESIRLAKPCDGLWSDNRSDEDSIGTTYEKLEWAMDFCEENKIETYSQYKKSDLIVSKEQKKILSIYLSRHEKNSHKMKMPPVCKL